MDLNKPLSMPKLDLSGLGRKKKDAPQPTGDASFVASLPRVNLVPPAAKERAAAAKAKTGAITVVAIAAVAVGGLYVSGFAAKGQARTSLNDATVAQAALSSDLAVYSPVTNLAAQTNSLTDTVAAQTRDEVFHGEVLEHFVRSVGAHGTISSVSLTTGTDASGCTSTDPFSQAALAGCVTFTVDSSEGPAAASLLMTSLKSDPWFVDPFIPTVSAGNEGTTALSGTVGLSVSAIASNNTTTTEAPTEPADGSNS